MRRTTWPAPTSVHDLQPGRRSLRLKGVKSGAAEIRTPIRGSALSHPYTGLATPFGVFSSPLSGVWDLWPLALTPTRGFWRPLSGSFFSPLSGVWGPGARRLGPFKSPLCPLSGVWDPGGRHLGPFKSPLCRVLRPLSGSCFFSPLFGVLLRHDEVVREPDILTGPAGLDVVVVEHFNYVSLPLMMPMPSLPFVTLLSQSLTEICPAPHRRDRKASR